MQENAKFVYPTYVGLRFAPAELGGWCPYAPIKIVNKNHNLDESKSKIGRSPIEYQEK